MQTKRSVTYQANAATRRLTYEPDFLIAEGWRGLNIRVSIIWKSDLRSDVIERRRGPGLSIRKRYERP